MATIKTKVKAFDFMISKKRRSYHCDPWYEEPGKSHYNSVQGLNGQVNYKDEIFIVNHEDGHSGCGGMDEGSPPSVTITRIKK